MGTQENYFRAHSITPRINRVTMNVRRLMTYDGATNSHSPISLYATFPNELSSAP